MKITKKCNGYFCNYVKYAKLGRYFFFEIIREIFCAAYFLDKNVLKPNRWSCIWVMMKVEEGNSDD